MQLSKVLLNIITFGSAKTISNLKDANDKLSKKYIQLKIDHNNMHDTLHAESQAKLQGQYEKSELIELLEKTEKVKREYEAKPLRLIPVEYYDFNDQEYLSAVSEIFNSKSFRCFLYNTQQDIYSKQVNAMPEHAVELIGMAKGISFIISRLKETEKAYKDLLQGAGNSQENSYD